MKLSNVYKRYITQWMALLYFLLATGLVHAGAFERLFSPKADLWNKWEQHTPESKKSIDHSIWDHFLQAYVAPGKDGINRMPYGKISPDGTQMLSRYISAMQSIVISQYSRPQQLAYWINLYNALTVNIVLQHYPIKSIRDIDISPGFFSDGPWGKKLFNLEDELISLNDIEHRILRPIWKDPRIHYAVNCASLGCPNLQRNAYTTDNIEHELDMAAREYINNPRGVRFEGDDLYVSSIYSWFQDDFGKNETQVIEHLRSFANPSLKQMLMGVNSITGDNYDWSLNDAITAPIKSTNGDE